ncbi:helix-turn-helix domain-containing protein [Microbacterium deminutum]|uniref:HTH tetR-type domain-containing protein n=1 Tax=Microbacterium deminutum TaxID=344164 RepID=A0ABN2Q984_9MICO
MAAAEILDDAPLVKQRAQPMTPDDRRAMIAEQAIPLFIEQGTSLTTRQLAEHLGIAEGTIFRAFGDKDALVRASVRAFFDGAEAHLSTGIVDASLPLEEKVARLVRGAREHAKGVFAMLSLLEPAEAGEYMARARSGAFEAAIAEAFAPDAEVLGVPSDRIAVLLRVAVVAASIPAHHRQSPLDDEELVQFILYGIAGRPRGKD